MLLPFLLAVIIGPADSVPREVVRHALRAVEGDSAPRLESRWQQAIETNPRDRLAALGLATLARLTYRFDEADRAYAALTPTVTGGAPAAGRASGRDAVTTYAQLGFGWSLDARGLQARADTAFVRARALAVARGDRVAESEALVALSVNRASRDGLRVGFALLDSAERLAPATALDLRSDIAVRRALLAVNRSRSTALAEAKAAAAFAHRVGEPRLEARALRALALGLELGQRLDSSERVLTTVEQIERAVNDRTTLSETLLRHGDIAHARGDIGAFKHYALMAQVEARASGNLYAAAASNIGLGATSLLLNDLVTAGQYLQRAATLYDTIQDASGFMLVRSFQADLAVNAGQWSVARDLAAQARDFYHHVGDPAEFDQWRDLIEFAIRAGDLPSAERSLTAAEALSRTRQQPRWYSDLDIDRGRLALAEGRPAAATAALRRYLQGLDPTEHVLRYTARTLLAEAEARQNQLDGAELELTAAADELDAWRATETDRELRPYIFQAGPTENNDRDAATARVLAALAAGGRTSVAFALAERRRARDLADRLVRLAALRDVAEDTSSSVSAKPPGSLTHDGDVAVRAAAERGAADSIAAALPDSHTALLEFITGAYGAPTTLLVVARPMVTTSLGIGPATLRAYAVPSADTLGPQIERFVALLEGGDDAASLGATLAAATVDSALRDLGPDVTRLVIVPDGPLYRVPFDALRAPDGRPLAAHYAISVAPSAAVLRALWRRPRPAGGDRRAVRLLALADPAFRPAAPGAGGTAGEDVYRDAFDSVGGLPRLAQSAREARLAARYAPSADVRLGRDASAAYLLRAPLDGYRVIHIATHALVDQRSIARTALVLAPGDGETGFVTPAQLASLHLDADLIVLSACRTAGGVVIDGDGVQGLTGPLLAAGARTVVATQWRIGDRAIVPLVDAFYAAMARGLSVGDALASAKRDALVRGEPARDWAAFTVIGDPSVHVGLRQPRGRLLLIIAALAVLVVAGAVIGSWQRSARSRGGQRAS